MIWSCTRRTLLVVGLTLALFVFLHDDRHPDSLTKSERDLVLKTLEETDRKIAVTLIKMKEFNTQPDNAGRRANELADAFSDWAKVSAVAYNDPAFYYHLDPNDKSIWATKVKNVNRQIESYTQELEDAAACFGKELQRRRDEIDLESDPFRKLKKSVENEPRRGRSAPCDRKECFSCRVRRAWRPGLLLLAILFASEASRFRRTCALAG